MNAVIMYSTRFCPYCIRARGLLQSKQVDFTDIAVDEAPERRLEMIERSGRYTVPQIFINDEPVGGYDDIAALNSAGELDALLGLEGPAEHGSN